MQETKSAQTSSPFSHLLNWASELPNWQQDALRRIVEKGTLDPVDIDELTLLCKVENGLEKSGSANAVPFDRSHVPSGAKRGQTVTLGSVSEIENANALDSKQELSFGQKGLTVVFGYNGSGKSGYGRILRRSCRARSKGAAILPNVLTGSNADAASAVIAYNLDGKEQKPEQWIDGQKTVDALGSVSFFDADCARVHVCERNDIAFTPVGMDVLPTLGRCCKSVQEKLSAERQRLIGSKPKFLESEHAKGAHSVGKYLQTLKADSDLEVLESLSSLTDAEKQRVSELPVLLAHNPKKESQALVLRARRLELLLQKLEKVSSALSTAKINELEALQKDADAKSKAAELAAKANFANDSLSGVGDATWRALWEAARQYSSQVYPTQEFPVTDSADAVCVLCQQELNPAAKDRLKRFESFVADTTATSAEKAKQLFAVAVDVIRNLDFQNDALTQQLTEIESTNPPVFQSVKTLLTNLISEQKAILEATTTRNWAAVVDVPTLLTLGELKTLIETTKQAAAKLDKAANADEHKKLTAELAELKAREWLSTVLGDVKTYLLVLLRISQLDACIAQTNTTKITKKSKQLAKEFVTDKLRGAFADEIKQMHQGTRRLDVELAATSGEYGSSYYRVQLVGAHKADVGTVVSEGEHRCIGLAGFLAELVMENSGSAIVLDDPVCSLDYHWAELFAKRLVAEAKRRQVIVFTHDVLFLHDLTTLAEAENVSATRLHLRPKGRTTGHVHGDLPTDLQGLKERLNYLDQDLAQIRKIYTSNNSSYESRVKAFYDQLRPAIERAVEERVFDGVMIRFRNEIKVGKLKKVSAFTRQDAEDLHNLHIKCSENMTGHDRASMRSGTRLCPDDLADDLAELRRVVSELNARQNGVK